MTGAFARSAAAWARLERHHRLSRPGRHLGRALEFADGTTSVVFRETRMVGPAPVEPAILVIRFRLVFLGRVAVAHAAFRRECLIHTPLFAGFPGFYSKLWLEDRGTRVYRGLYEWDGESAAGTYAECMVGLLRPFSNRATCGYHIVPGIRRDEVLRDPGCLGPGSGTEWWKLRARLAA